MKQENELPSEGDTLDVMVIKLMSLAFSHGSSTQRFLDAQADLTNVQQEISEGYAAYKQLTTPPEGVQGDN